jgi:Ca2+:H+ antiporter
MSLLSIIPLAYFVGQAVASISAQSSIGMGAAINAFFGSVIEIFLYCVALSQGKGLLVEGSIVGSILAGILLMPGLSMCSGAVIRKTLRFNAKAAGITSTMMLFAVIGAFGPTLFYQIYGSVRSCAHRIDANDSTSSSVMGAASIMKTASVATLTRIPQLVTHSTRKASSLSHIYARSCSCSRT